MILDQQTKLHARCKVSEKLKKPTRSEQSATLGNRIGSHVESIRTCSFILDDGYVLDLERTIYIPTFSKYYISVSRLAPLGYSSKSS